MGNVLVNEETLTQIADAIREKMGNNDSYKPGEMPGAILEISTYSGEGADPDKPIRFYDPYGNLAYSYTVNEFSGLTELPPLPELKGLIGQGWNWSLENILEIGDEIEIGSLYITDDGSTRIYVELIEETLNPKIGFRQMTANSVAVDWGDESPLETSDIAGKDTMVSIEHQYSKAGSYTIRLIPEDDAEFTFLGDSYSTRILHKDINYNHANKAYGNTIRKIELGKGITEFTGRCFYSYSIESVTIPEAITSFSTAFQGCYGIKVITFPRGVSSLTSYAVRECRGLEKILFSDSTVSLGGTSLANCSNLRNVIIPSSVQLTYTDIFADCIGLNRIVLAEKISKIPADMFDGCYLLKDVVMKGEITSIGSGAFKNCRSLEYIELSDDLTEIGSSVFYCCYALKRIRLPKSIKSIASAVFYSCYALQEIVIPENVAEIKSSAFSSCCAMENYYMMSNVPPILENVNAFSEIPETCKIHIPKGCLEAYQTAENWSTYAGYMVEMEEEDEETE